MSQTISDDQKDRLVQAVQRELDLLDQVVSKINLRREELLVTLRQLSAPRVRIAETPYGPAIEGEVEEVDPGMTLSEGAE